MVAARFPIRHERYWRPAGIYGHPRDFDYLSALITAWLSLCTEMKLLLHWPRREVVAEGTIGLPQRLLFTRLFTMLSSDISVRVLSTFRAEDL